MASPTTFMCHGLHATSVWLRRAQSLLACIVTGEALAQYPTLAPTVDTTIVVSGNVLHYSTIDIPSGVTVRFVAPGLGRFYAVPGMPAVVLCDGDATVHGTLSVAADGSNEFPAGWVTTGEGIRGYLCGTVGGAGYLYIPPPGGLHAGTYGSVVPFSLDGGSPGGYLDRYTAGCWQWLNQDPGGRPGGTLALIAQGSISVDGSVTADGFHSGGASGGSGGSILLRGAGGVTVYPTGSVTARGGRYIINPTPPPVTNGAPGYLRIDAYASTPVIQGTIDPPPTVLELPHLRTQSPPQVGTTWILDVLAPVSALIVVAVSLQANPGTSTPFGILGIDLSQAASLAAAVAQPSHDPIAGLPLPVPSMPALVGLQLWVQGFVAPSNLTPRLTNTLATVVH